MNYTSLLDKHFPKEEYAAVELYARNGANDELMIYLNKRFDWIAEGKTKGTYSLWQRGGGDYPSMRVSQYTVVSVYDISDKAKVRAFMMDSLQQATDDELRDSLSELFCCG